MHAFYLVKFIPKIATFRQVKFNVGPQRRNFQTCFTCRKDTGRHDKLDASFSNSEEAYKSKTTWEIFRGLLVLQSLTIDALAENQTSLIKWGRRFLGQSLFEKVMKGSYYGHFVAGKDQNDIAPKIQRMRKYGVNAILDYSAEEDISPNDRATSLPHDISNSSTKDEKRMKKYSGNIDVSERKKRAIARTYAYYNEGACEKNKQIFLESIKAVEGTTEGTGFAAIKATAIENPQLLLRKSAAIEIVREFVDQLKGEQDSVSNKKIDMKYLRTNLEQAAKEDPAIEKWLAEMEKSHEESDAAGLISIIPWGSLLTSKKCVTDAFRIPNKQTGKMECMIQITENEMVGFQNAVNRFHEIFKAASAGNVRVMVDAEQTYLQPAISRITIEMMKIYNVKRPIVFNTYQCYLKNAHQELVTDLSQAERQNFHFGAKLVRGAYMEQERQRALDMNYDDPVNPSYQATTDMYELCMDECLWRIKKSKDNGQPKRIKVMAATHNEDTIRFVLRKMKEYGITPEDHVVSFGQLYGMCDHISFPLGQSGYSAYKYIPYGPVLEVLPYLSRRAQENRGMLGKTNKERTLLKEELFRRIFTGNVFYKPN